MSEREVRKERSGWRDPDLKGWHRKHGFDCTSTSEDLDLNNRHRDWGWNCPVVDIDQLFVEYDACFPVAIVDYKLRKKLTEPEPNRSAANYLALSKFSTTKGQVPFFVTYYTKGPWSFRPIWINTQAKQVAPKKPCLTELGFVEWLYWLRNHTIDALIIKKLDNEPTWGSLPLPDLNHGAYRKKGVKPLAPTLFNQDPPLQCSLWEKQA